MLEELQKVVGELYNLYGATTQVVKLSQILDELINTIILAVLPLANLVIAFDNLIMLFRSKPQFILRYMFVRSRLNEITIIKDENKEEDKEC